MKTIELWDHWLEGLEPELEGYVIGHPVNCLGIYHWDRETSGGIFAVAPNLSLEHPHCPIEYESYNIGLTDRWRHDGSWTSLWVEDFPGGEEAILALVERHAADDTPMPIFVTVTYGWSPSTPNAPSEYEWEFAWRPQTPEEIAEHTKQPATL